MGALFGDPQVFISELIWTVINFFLLLFLLKRFLFNPVLRFMEDRKARIDAKIEEERNAEAKFAENTERLQAEKAKSREEAKDILTRSGEEREQRRAAAIAEARAASEQALKDGENALAQKREKTAENLQAATPELAELLAERLFSKE